MKWTHLTDFQQVMRIENFDELICGLNIPIVAKNAQRTTECFRYCSNLGSQAVIGMLAPIDGMTAVPAQLQQQAGGAGQYGTKGEILELAHEAPITVGKNSQHAQGDPRMAQEHVSKVRLGHVPDEAIFQANDGGRINITIHRRNFIEHDNRLKQREDGYLSLGAENAKLDATFKQDK